MGFISENINFSNIFSTAKIVLIEAKRRKDFYVIFILSILLIILFSSIHFFNLEGITNECQAQIKGFKQPALFVL